MAVQTVVRVTDEDSREDLAETLAHLNTAAKAMSRRGKCGTLSAAYAVQHGRIDAVLTELLAKAP
jgi:hypothetical protein